MKTILIVEDNDVILQNVAEMLSLANYDVLTAKDGREGIELAKTNSPDLIISDIMMPVVDGFGMLHMLRRDPKTEAIPFIFLTAKSERNDFRNAMESGADDFISKPFNNDELLKAIENRFKRLEVMGKKLVDHHQSQLPGNSSTETLEQLFLNSETRTYRKREVIYKEGAVPRYIYYILNGKIRTSKTHEIGKQLSIDLYKPGDYLGYVALIENSNYKETADAIDNDTEVAMVPRKNFEELLRKNPVVAQKIIKILAHNVTEKEEHLLEIAYNTLRQKVAGTLINLKKKFQVSDSETYAIDLTRDELASMAGTAMESFIRVLGEFKSEKLIDIKRDNKIEIVNFRKLESLLK